MADIIQEITEDIKTEKFLYVIKNFTKIFIIISLVILLITSAVVYRNYKHEQKQLAFSIDYFRLVNANIDDLRSKLYKKFKDIQTSVEIIRTGKNLRLSDNELLLQKFGDSYIEEVVSNFDEYIMAKFFFY